MYARTRRARRQAGNVILSSVLVVLALGLSAVGAAQLVRSRLDGAAEIRRSSFAALQARQITEGVVNWALVRLNDPGFLPLGNVLPAVASDSAALTVLPGGVTINSTLGNTTPTLTAAFSTTPATLAKNAVFAGTTTLSVTSTVTSTVGGVATSYPHTQTVRFVQTGGNWEARR
ncbi:MAG: hypothetical protein VKP72_06515 [bacterium]|nr:hypothetical protein [bacterium]